MHHSCISCLVRARSCYKKENVEVSHVSFTCHENSWITMNNQESVFKSDSHIIIAFPDSACLML